MKARADGSWTADGMGNEIVPQSYGMKGPSGTESAIAEEQPSLTASHGQPGNVALPIAFSHYASDAQASTEVTPTLLAGTNVSGPAVAQAFNWQSGGDARGLDLTDEPSALTTQQTPAVLLTMREGSPGGGKGPLLVKEESLTLATGNGQTLFQPQPEQYGVRRLTPVECERLQAFPDGWTEPAVSDSARYKALGNAVTVNTVRWVLGRMLEQS